MRHNIKGFTLVELLIVLAVIGILAAIAIPKYHKYTTKSKIATLQADLKNAYLAAQGYMMERGFDVTEANSLFRQGYKATQGVEVVSVNMSTNSGEIILRHLGLTTDSATGNTGTISYNGIITVPTLKD